MIDSEKSVRCACLFSQIISKGAKEFILPRVSKQVLSRLSKILLFSIPEEGTDFLFFIVFRPRESEDGREGGERKEKEDHLIAVSAFKNSPASHPENNGR